MLFKLNLNLNLIWFTHMVSQHSNIRLHTVHALIKDVWLTFKTLIGIVQTPENGFPVRDGGTLVYSNPKQKNKRLNYVWSHELSASCHPNVNTKAPERTPSNFSYSVNLQTRMPRIHWQIAVTEQRTLQWTNPFEHSAFCRERQPAKTGHWSYVAIVSFLMEHCCFAQQSMTVF